MAWEETVLYKYRQRVRAISSVRPAWRKPSRAPFVKAKNAGTSSKVCLHVNHGDACTCPGLNLELTGRQQKGVATPAGQAFSGLEEETAICFVPVRIKRPDRNEQRKGEAQRGESRWNVLARANLAVAA